MDRVWANKKFGQHFLHQKSIIDRIIQMKPDGCCGILEVGPGTGALTRPLHQLQLPLRVLETDHRMAPILEQLLPTQDIFFGDALEEDPWPALLAPPFPQEKLWLVSNLPYNISSLLFLQFIQKTALTELTLMFQKEVGEKILNTQKINSLALQAHCLGQVKKVVTVSPGAFTPPPKVQSLVLHWKRANNPRIRPDQWPQFQQFIRPLFLYKRKTLGKIAKDLLPSQHPLKRVPLANFAQARPEDLTVEDFCSLYKNYGEDHYPKS